LFRDTECCVCLLNRHVQGPGRGLMLRRSATCSFSSAQRKHCKKAKGRLWLLATLSKLPQAAPVTKLQSAGLPSNERVRVWQR